jgi:hypothetical protein
MDDKKIQFLPFHAINAFMRPDYRLEVVKTLLSDLSTVPEGKRAQLTRFIKQYVVIPGFRHSVLAPLSVKIKPFIAVFEKKPELAALTIDIWATQHSDLRDKAFQFLVERGWEILPLDADRTKLPGFMTTWPKDEDFEVINKAFTAKYPDAGYSEDNVSLMVVWLSGRLPYQTIEEEAGNEGA